MARYEHLPVYRAAMELVVYLEKAVRNFSRYQKYGVGSDLRDLSRQVVLLIIRVVQRSAIERARWAGISFSPLSPTRGKAGMGVMHCGEVPPTPTLPPNFGGRGIL